MRFHFFDTIHHHRQSFAQYQCPDIIGDEAYGFCIDASELLPAGSTARHESEAVSPFCSTTKYWRDA
jgi:hypothetical protein